MRAWALAFLIAVSVVSGGFAVLYTTIMLVEHHNAPAGAP